MMINFHAYFCDGCGAHFAYEDKHYVDHSDIVCPSCREDAEVMTDAGYIEGWSNETR